MLPAGRLKGAATVLLAVRWLLLRVLGSHDPVQQVSSDRHG
jgi:hypothetical protein